MGVLLYLFEPGIPLLPAHPYLDRLVHQPCRDYHAMELSEGLGQHLDCLDRLARRWWWHGGQRLRRGAWFEVDVSELWVEIRDGSTQTADT